MGLRTFILRLSFVTYSAVPARCEPHWLLSFVTYSAAPARRLSFAYPSLNLRSSFAQPSLGRILNSEF